MKGDGLEYWLLFMALVLAFAPSGRCNCNAARAAAPAAPAQLVQAWVSEAGWLAHREHAIQAHVLARWARQDGKTLRATIEQRVWRFSRPAAWIRQLSPRCEQPAAWPPRLSWARHAPLCRALFARAEAFGRGEVPDPCPAARGWRRPGKASAAAFVAGRKRVWCGKTANVYIR